MQYPILIDRPLELYAGDHAVFAWRLADPAGSLRLDDWDNWRCEWRDGNLLEELDLDMSQAAAGIITLSIPAEQTRRMRGRGAWDIQSDLGGIVRTWVRGTTTWTEDITR